MSDPSQTRAISECQAEVGPPRSAAQIIAAQGAALGSLMQAAGVTTCTQSTAAALTLFGAGAAQFTRGCEQLAAMSSAMDASQRVFACTFTKLVQTNSTTVRTNLNAEFKLGTGVSVQNCSFVITQKSGMRVAKYSTMTQDIKDAMTAELDAAMEGFLHNMQEEKTKGLFPSTAGQKAFASFTQVLEQKIEQKAFKDTVQEVMEIYENNASFIFEVGPYSALGFQNNAPGQACVTLNQDFVTQIVSQNILTAALENVFSAEGSADMKQILQTGQYKVNEGFTGLDFGAIAIVIVIIIIMIVLVTSKKKDQNGESKNVISGKTGLIFGSILLIIGVAGIIAGIVMLLLKKSTIIAVLLLIGGAILGIIGLVMLLKGKSQMAEFEQQLQLTKAQNKPAEEQVILQKQQLTFAQQQAFAQQQQQLQQPPSSTLAPPIASTTPAQPTVSTPSQPTVSQQIMRPFTPQPQVQLVSSSPASPQPLRAAAETSKPFVVAQTQQTQPHTLALPPVAGQSTGSVRVPPPLNVSYQAPQAPPLPKLVPRALPTSAMPATTTFAQPTINMPTLRPQMTFSAQATSMAEPKTQQQTFLGETPFVAVR